MIRNLLLIQIFLRVWVLERNDLPGHAGVGQGKLRIKPCWGRSRETRNALLSMSVAKGRRGLLLNEVSDQRENTEKAELLSIFFASIFTSKPPPQDSWTLEGRERVWEMVSFPLVEKRVVQDYQGGTNMHKSMGPDGMHPCVLRELAEVIAELLSIIFDRSWRTEVPEDWRTASVTPVFKKGKKEDPRNYRPVSLTSGKDRSPRGESLKWRPMQRRHSASLPSLHPRIPPLNQQGTHMIPSLHPWKGQWHPGLYQEWCGEQN